ncbi:hypothetical protein IPH25_03925 [bacterium]|nr:MAG: hypothetical protein IPG37_00920 [bacterium]QQR61597.1 MAG: hypothetical protein IPH25_03925 [bacterium]QQR62844.1 MAG: hypothetical protein IPH67_05575 [bacterium]
MKNFIKLSLLLNLITIGTQANPLVNALSYTGGKFGSGLMKLSCNMFFLPFRLAQWSFKKPTRAFGFGFMGATGSAMATLNPEQRSEVKNIYQNALQHRFNQVDIMKNTAEAFLKKNNILNHE